MKYRANESILPPFTEKLFCFYFLFNPNIYTIQYSLLLLEECERKKATT